MHDTGLQELNGYKILVVEDEMLVAVDHCEQLAKAGAEILGPFTSVSQALKCVDTTAIDVAVLDYALSDQTSDPLQSALEQRKIPFIVVTGYPRVLVRRSATQRVLSKPVTPLELCQTIRDICQ